LIFHFGFLSPVKSPQKNGVCLTGLNFFIYFFLVLLYHIFLICAQEVERGQIYGENWKIGSYRENNQSGY